MSLFSCSSSSSNLEEEVKYIIEAIEVKQDEVQKSVNVTENEFKCIVCYELPLEVMETSCCGVIICSECAVKLNSCP